MKMVSRLLSSKVTLTIGVLLIAFLLLIGLITTPQQRQRFLLSLLGYKPFSTETTSRRVETSRNFDKKGFGAAQTKYNEELAKEVTEKCGPKPEENSSNYDRCTLLAGLNQPISKPTENKFT